MTKTQIKLKYSNDKIWKNIYLLHGSQEIFLDPGVI